MFHLLYGGKYHENKVTHWLLGDILSLQKVKRNIGQENKVEERLVILGLSIKVIYTCFISSLIFFLCIFVIFILLIILFFIHLLTEEMLS
jgi:hypothetical protein